MSDKLKKIRDKTHFHIDKDAVNDPEKVWEAAGLKGVELREALDYGFRVMNFLHTKYFKSEFPFPEYDGADAEKVALFVQNFEQAA